MTRKPHTQSSDFAPLPRRAFAKLLALGGLFAGIRGARAAEQEELKFPGEDPNHKVVYQFNKAEEEYHKAVLFSVGAMVRKYGDDIAIAVVCIGPGLHVLAKKPKRPVAKEVQEQISSLDQYGVKFIACGNTMKSLHWTADDLVPFAHITEVGAAELMELQQKGYAYISW